MILLEYPNRIVETTLSHYFIEQVDKSDALDISFNDFDGITYHLLASNVQSSATSANPAAGSASVTSTSPFLIQLSITLPAFQKLVQYGAVELLNAIYEPLDVKVETASQNAQSQEDFDVRLSFSCALSTAATALAEDEKKKLERTFHHIALLRRHCVAAPFRKAFMDLESWLADAKEKAAASAALKPTSILSSGAGPVAASQVSSKEQGKQGELMVIPYRSDEALYIQAYEDRVIVIFSTVFRDPTDIIIGRVFTQEFVDARKLPHLQTAPQVLFSKEPPRELSSLSLKNSVGGKGSEEAQYGYITFVLFPRHTSLKASASTKSSTSSPLLTSTSSIQFDSPGEAAISLIQTFRDYLHYHIKCSKAYLHSRMRGRVSEYLKILNRAKPQMPSAERKLASGKTFKRS